MARGNEIIVSADPRGIFAEGYIAAGQTPKPGTVMQLDPTVAIRSGRFTFKQYAAGTNGNRPPGGYWVLREDHLRGRLVTDAYAAGDRAFLYAPAMGEQLNVIIKDVAGTADTHLAGEVLIVETGSGKLLATTGTPQSQPFLLLETIAAPTADTLAWVMFSGY